MKDVHLLASAPTMQAINRWPHFLATLVFFFVFASSAIAADWVPTKAIEIVIPSSVGSGQDSIGRAIQRIIQDKRLVDTPVTAVNKPGGSQAIGYNYVNQHAGDPHYLAICTVNLVSNSITGTNPLTYTDVTPIAIMAQEYLLIVVRGDSPIKDGKDFVNQLQRDPSSLSVGFAPGPGGSAHITLGLVAKATGIDVSKLKIVLFKGGGAATIAVLGGHIDAAVTAVPVVLSQMQAGKIRALAVAAPRRLSGATASIPTWRELGVNAVFTNWRGIFGPRGMRPDQIAFWEGVLREVTKTEEWKQMLQKDNKAEVFYDARESKKFLAAQYVDFRSVLTDLGLAK
ncbi:MAG: tripartite tricarboxylate transporter substrate binding protein [Betaproteobacteria bacterium]|nr:tripartite tricarboxylate transporter substrate binding protein [Betaproteobacteria bacterium]